MADVADMAADTEQQHRDEALARQRATAQRQLQSGSMQAYVPHTNRLCGDCGEEIDPRRVKALPHTGRCTPCAEIAERHFREEAWKPSPSS